MEEFEFDKIDFIEKVFELYPNLNINKLAEEYFKQSKLNFDEYQEDGIDKDFGYMLYASNKDSNNLLIAFSNKYVTIENISKFDPIWINIIAKKLKAKSYSDYESYLNDVQTTLNRFVENKDELGFQNKELKNLQESLFAIDAGVFTPEKPTLTEAEKTSYMLQNEN